MGFVDHDDVPLRLLQVRAIFGVLLQCVDRDDGFVVVIERVVIGGDAAAYPLNADGVQPCQGDGEAVPELLLELRQHALHGQHEDAPAASPGDEFAYEDASFQRLAETDAVGDQDALAGSRER